MKVKIGNKLYNSYNEPIMIILEDFEKQHISQMGDQSKYCSFPENCNVEEIKEFMKTEDKR